MAFEVPGTEAIFMRFGLFTPTASDLAERAAENTTTTALTTKTPATPTLIMGSHSYRRAKGVKSSGTFEVKSRMHLWDLDLLADGIIGQGAMEITIPAGVSFKVVQERGSSQSRKKKKTSLMPPSAVPSRLSLGARTRETSMASSDISGVTEDTIMGGTDEVNGAASDKSKAAKEAEDKQARWGPYTPQKAHKIIEVGTTLKVPDFTPRSAAWSMDGKICVVVGSEPAAIWVLGRD